MESAFLLAIQAIGTLAANTDKIEEIIAFLEKVIPIAVKLGEAFYQSIKNIIDSLRGQTSDADQLAKLDALDAQADAEFDALAAEASPEAAAAGKAAADEAAAGDQPAPASPPADPAAS